MEGVDGGKWKAGGGRSVGPLTPPPTFAGSPPGTGAWVLAHPRNDLWGIRLSALGHELTAEGGAVNLEYERGGNSESAA